MSADLPGCRKGCVPDYLPLLKKDILAVIKKYVDIGEEQVVVQLDTQDDCEVLGLNITWPDETSDDTSAGKDRTRSRSARTRANQTRAGQVAAASRTSSPKRAPKERSNGSAKQSGLSKGKETV